MLKKLINTLIVTGVLGVTCAAHANDLTITNNTMYDSTSIINRGACSTILGKMGVTHPGQTNVIPGSKVKFACLLNRSNCRADVFMTKDCTGPIIATVFFDVKTGVKSINMLDPIYQITANGFHIELSGGPK